MTQSTSVPADWRELKIDGFMGHIGPLLRSTNLEDGKLYGLQTDKRHLNPIGVIHGGVITSVLDQAIALEAWNAADQNPTVTIQMDARFLNASRVGDFLKVSVKIHHMTRSLIFVDAKMFSGLSQVANASAIMKIVHNLKESNG